MSAPAASAPALRTRSEALAWGGRQGFYEHASAACGQTMRFGVYLPPQALAGAKVPAVYCLAGLTCTEETFAIKAGAQRVAAELGLALVTPDTSPRARIAGDDASWDFGLAASFYLDATQDPWRETYQMQRWISDELVNVVEAALPIASDRRGILGHSMGGHGALMTALRNPRRYASCSAFAPIASPSDVPWGQKAFTGYLGEDRATWSRWDATRLVRAHTFPGTLLIDQGTADNFLQRELQPERFEAACAVAGQSVSLRLREGYDHSYWFIQTFVEEHLRHHGERLQ